MWWAEESVQKGDACNIAKHKLGIKAIGAGTTDARTLTQIKESARRMMTDAKTRMEGQYFLDYHHMCRLVTDWRPKRRIAGQHHVILQVVETVGVPDT